MFAERAIASANDVNENALSSTGGAERSKDRSMRMAQSKVGVGTSRALKMQSFCSGREVAPRGSLAREAPPFLQRTSPSRTYFTSIP